MQRVPIRRSLEVRGAGASFLSLVPGQETWEQGEGDGQRVGGGSHVDMDIYLSLYQF